MTIVFIGSNESCFLGRCGKGGDLLKWQKAGVDHVVCADIAGTSVEQAESRYRDMRGRRGGGGRLFTAEFITADCTKERLKDKYREPGEGFDLVSCQFAFHYCFESLPQAECMLRNAAECLNKGQKSFYIFLKIHKVFYHKKSLGGFFIGTTPDAYDIVQRLKQGKKLEDDEDDKKESDAEEDKVALNKMRAGNSVYDISNENFDPFDGTKIPLFGARYRFRLEVQYEIKVWHR